MVFIIIGIFLILIFLYCPCKKSSICSKKEEQEETIKKLEGKEYMLDDENRNFNIQDELGYDDEFVRKENKNG